RISVGRMADARNRPVARLVSHANRCNPEIQNGSPRWAAVVPTRELSHQLTELSAFYAELVAKGGDRAVGEAFYDSWTAALDRYSLIPEVIDYRTLAI